METFNNLFAQYATEKGFTPNSNGELYQKSLLKFMCFQEWYRNQMGIETFKNLVIN